MARERKRSKKSKKREKKRKKRIVTPKGFYKDRMLRPSENRGFEQ
jgi:hypothetical protein